MTVEVQGSYHDKENNIIYAFISNGTSSYLCKTNDSAISWDYVEATPTAFGITYKAYFVQYKDYIVFTKNEKKQISDYGGTFYINGTAIAFFGVSNNPTAEVIEVHNDRLFVGNMSYQANSAVSGRSWVGVSKIFPEPSDTSFVLSAMTVGTRTLITANTHTFAINDEVYISGIVGTAGSSNLNGRFHVITGIETNKFWVDVDTTGLVYTSDGTAILRGNTWSSSSVIYDDVTSGSGIFKCDSNESDKVVNLCSAFGVMVIFRINSIYFFTGSIESGDATLAKKLTIAYGAESASLAISAGGIWFVSKYGLSKVEGTSVKTSQTQFDNVVDITVSEVIKPTWEAITNKNKLLVNMIGHRVMVYDKDKKAGYVFDTLTNQWTIYNNILADNILTVNYDVYALYKNLVFKLDNGYEFFDMSSYSKKPLSSTYRTGILELSNGIDYKTLDHLRMLIAGVATTATTALININIYYNAGNSIGRSFSFNIKTGTLTTWYSVSNSETDTWDTITSNGTLTWSELLGTNSSMLYRDSYNMGTATSFQFEIQHTGAEEFRVSNIMLEYDDIRR